MAVTFLVRKNSTNQENEKLKTQRFKLENLSALGQDEGGTGEDDQGSQTNGKQPQPGKRKQQKLDLSDPISFIARTQVNKTDPTNLAV